MKQTKTLQTGKAPFELIEEAFHLLRLSPASTLATYYLGSLPFVLVLLFFWSDMSRSAFAEQRLAAAAFALSLLFLWMKVWQAVFAQGLLARLAGEAAPRWTLLRWLRLGLVQAILQPSGLFLVPLALCILVPFGWTYAFYQNVSALGDGQERDLRQVFKRSWRQAKLWPLQNHYILFVLKFFAVFVFLNLATGMLAVPFLLNKLLGVESVFTQSWSAIFNTTFFAVVFGLTYLCLDPILKTIYVLRCFYGESLKTGRDLKAELKTLQPRAPAGAAIVLLLLGLIAPADRLFAAGAAESQFSNPKLQITQAQAAADSKSGSAEGSLSGPDLDRAIDQVLNQREFTWRMPREKLRVKEETKKGTIATFLESILDTLKDWFKAIGRWMGDFLRWLGKYFRPRPGSGNSGIGWISTIYGLLWVVAIGLVCALIFLIFRVWQNWRRLPADVAAEAIVPAPDLADENVGADELPEDGWLKLARELLENGEFRLALRAFYLASLVRLAASNLITIARFKSNRDYEHELQRRAHALPEVLSTFAQNVSIFDRVWYGLHDVNHELVTLFAANIERLKPEPTLPNPPR